MEGGGDARPSREVRLAVEAGPFLPVFTAGISVASEIRPRLFWGGGVHAFHVLGKSVHAGLFLELVSCKRSGVRVSSRIGPIVGWNEEFSFGPPPQTFWGAGVHVDLLRVTLALPDVADRTERFFAGLDLGVRAISDGTRIAGSASILLLAGVVTHAR